MNPTEIDCKYRVYRLLLDMGWADFDLGVPTSSQQPNLIPIRPCRIGQAVEHSNFPSTQPNPQVDGMPCTAVVMVGFHKMHTNPNSGIVTYALGKSQAGAAAKLKYPRPRFSLRLQVSLTSLPSKMLCDSHSLSLLAAAGEAEDSRGPESVRDIYNWVVLLLRNAFRGSDS